MKREGSRWGETRDRLLTLGSNPSLSRAMKRAFTLIELLVVIAIIAILAAILFPVFAQAKLAAKKTKGLAQFKQVGTGLQIYLGDSDDVLPAYRFTAALANPPINPYYLSLPAGDAKKATLDANGQNTIHAAFYNQLLQPYIKSDDMFRSTEYSNAWVNFQDKRLPADPGFHSYGGQNSMAANLYLLKAKTDAATDTTSMLSATSVEAPSDTLLFIDATYYGALPAQPNNVMCKLNDYGPTSASYPHYWKHLGNDELNFTSLGNPDPTNAANATVIKQIEARYGGVLNMVRVDTSAKATQAKAVVNNLKDKGKDSYWNPLKTDCQ